jgi:hypothetical protein
VLYFLFPISFQTNKWPSSFTHSHTHMRRRIRNVNDATVASKGGLNNSSETKTPGVTSRFPSI